MVARNANNAMSKLIPDPQNPATIARSSSCQAEVVRCICGSETYAVKARDYSGGWSWCKCPGLTHCPENSVVVVAVTSNPISIFAFTRRACHLCVSGSGGHAAAAKHT